MKATIIKKHGAEWKFKTITAAKIHIKSARRQDYEIKVINGEKVAVWDERI